MPAAGDPSLVVNLGADGGELTDELGRTEEELKAVAKAMRILGPEFEEMWVDMHISLNRANDSLEEMADEVTEIQRGVNVFGNSGPAELIKFANAASEAYMSAKNLTAAFGDWEGAIRQIAQDWGDFWLAVNQPWDDKFLRGAASIKEMEAAMKAYRKEYLMVIAENQRREGTSPFAAPRETQEFFRGPPVVKATKEELETAKMLQRQAEVIAKARQHDEEMRLKAIQDQIKATDELYQKQLDFNEAVKNAREQWEEYPIGETVGTLTEAFGRARAQAQTDLFKKSIEGAVADVPGMIMKPGELAGKALGKFMTKGSLFEFKKGMKGFQDTVEEMLSPKRRDEGFRASIESLTGLYRSVQAGAASRTPADRNASASDKNTTATNNNTSALENIPAKIATAVKDAVANVVGTFGAP